MKRLIALLLVSMLPFCMLTGCSTKEALVIHTYEELSIRLPESFVDLGSVESFADYDFIFSDGTVTVAGIRQDRDQLREAGIDPTLEEFLPALIRAHGLDCQPLQAEGFHYFNYEAGSAQLFTYVVTVRETEAAFWTVQAYCPSERYAAVKDAIWQYLNAVTV